MSNQYTAIGLMSGSSLDGLDMVAVKFTENHGKWEFEVIAAECTGYNEDRVSQLAGAPDLSQHSLMALHTGFGEYLGESTKEFILKNGLDGKVDLVCSHGHTVLHDPAGGYTLQIGDGAQIAAVTGIPVVSDLRTKDVAMGGQGAPIVPIGERHLFHDIKMFLNIGGIANISYHSFDKVVAYDVCPGNTPLNLLARQHGFEYDEGGRLAAGGSLLPELFAQLKDFSFYERPLPRSLHTDVIKKDFMPVIDLFPGSLPDKLHTVTEHLAMEISKHISDLGQTQFGKILITGGGAWNTFLIERIRHYSRFEVVVPDALMVDYKEAVVMAFFGVLRMRGEVNCLSSVTGARADSVGGALYI